MKATGCKWYGKCQWRMDSCDGCAYMVPAVRIQYCSKMIVDMFGEDICGLQMIDGQCPKCGG